MAVTIVNPARFNNDGLGTRRYIRAAFFDEGYGVSTSFKAYAQGAGIVPATSAFNGIGAATGGDPLRMSQFSGFVVPSLLAVSLVNHALEAESVVGSMNTTATVGFVLSSSGQALIRIAFGGIDAYNTASLDGDELNISGDPQDIFIENWLDGGSAGDVSAFVTKGSGSTLAAGSDSLSTYLPLSTTREWKLRAVRTSSGVTNAATTITVQLVSTSNTANVLATATMSLTAIAQAII